MQHEQKWLNLKEKGYRGSVSIRTFSETTYNTDPGYNDKYIHDSILAMDPEYTYVKVIHEGYREPTSNIPTIKLGKDIQKNQEILDQAIIEGLAHLRIFREAQSNAIVEFGYDLNEA